MFRILNERTNFYQWDLDQKLILEDSTITEVHFSNGLEAIALVCAVYELDGKKLVNVPNVLLQNSVDIKAYAYCNEQYTKQSCILKVIPRSKPADYVYTETDVITIEKIVEDELQKAAISGKFKGDKGEKGDKGDKGAKGDKGEQGSAREAIYHRFRDTAVNFQMQKGRVYAFTVDNSDNNSAYIVDVNGKTVTGVAGKTMTGLKNGFVICADRCSGGGLTGTLSLFNLNAYVADRWDWNDGYREQYGSYYIRTTTTDGIDIWEI